MARLYHFIGVFFGISLRSGARPSGHTNAHRNNSHIPIADVPILLSFLPCVWKALVGEQLTDDDIYLADPLAGELLRTLVCLRVGVINVPFFFL